MAKLAATDMDVAEIHDAFSILEIMGYEDLGLVKKGEGGKFVNQTNLEINPRGGIIGCGHPIGVTGIAQTVSVVEYLTGKHKLKIQRPKKSTHYKGIVHNLAAAGTSATVLILEN
jgi:acetyl-CoA C-acetyltransferase